MEAFLQTLLGGFLALAGSAIGPFLQRKHDRWVANREDSQLIRDKAQELFDELDRITSVSGQASTRVLERLKDENLEARQVPELGRVRAISALYFPGSLPLIQTFEDEAGKLMEEVVKLAENTAANADRMKGLPVLMTLKHQKLASKFVRSMREHVNGVLPKLDVKRD